MGEEELTFKVLPLLSEYEQEILTEALAQYMEGGSSDDNWFNAAREIKDRLAATP